MSERPARRVVCFVSYSHQDSDFVDFLERMLAHYRNGVELLRDRGGVDRSEALDSSLREMVGRCEVFLPVISPAYVRSTWCECEYAWLLERPVGARIVPLRLVPDATAFPNHLGVDFTAWGVRGDRIVREVLAPTLVGGAATTHAATPDLDTSLALQMARDFRTLGAAVQRIDLASEADQAFSQIGVRLMQMPGMPAPGRALVASVLAGQQVQRGRWEALRRWSSESLAQLGEFDPDLGRRSDDELTFLGERLMELALAERRLGLHDDAAKHYEEAMSHNGAISDPILRGVRRAQVFRELGTLALARLKLDDARRMYEHSRELLESMPSERMHVAQTWIKQAQVDLVAGRDEMALRCIGEADRILHPSQGDGAAPMLEGELRARVAAHYWKTLAWVDFTRGDRKGLQCAISEHANVIAPFPWDNERSQQRALQGLAALSPMFPAWVARTLARGFIVAESGLLARVTRPVRVPFEVISQMMGRS